MGCSDSMEERNSTQESEEHLRELEAAIGFQSHPSRHLDLFIRKYASTVSMNKNQFRLIGQKLNVTLTNSEKLRTAEIYFSDLLYYKGEYDRTAFLIVGILMGRGVPEEKARLLFEIFDTDMTEKISLKDATLLVSVMTRISLEEVERLVSYELLSTLAAKDMKTYLAKLMSVLPDVESHMQETLFRGKDTYHLQGFLAAVRTPQGSRMLSTVGIRKLAMEIYEKKVAERATKEKSKSSGQAAKKAGAKAKKKIATES